MSLRVASLNSGSNGNCYYIGNEHDAVLIDAGISCRETEQRMKRLELPMSSVRGIFITHEHADHIYGVKMLSKKHRIPVYITPRTQRSGRLNFRPGLASEFETDQPVSVGTLSVTGFSKYHDAEDPHSFLVSDGAVTVGVFTDIGRPCSNLIRCFQLCHAAFLESNYDEDMLDTGPYPYVLKNRIRGGFGHLSNVQAAELFNSYRPPYMSHVFLSHLSKANNSPEIAASLFAKVAGRTSVIVASRDQESSVYSITGTFRDNRAPLNIRLSKRALQLSFWD